MAKLTIKDALSTSLTRTKQYIDTELAKKADSSHGTHLTIGTGSGNAAAGNHTHNYAGSSSVGGAATSANKVNQNLVVKLNGGTTEGTNLFTFNGSTAKTINITPSSIGAAPTSHASTATTYGAASASNYGHAMASSTTPKANGTAAVGSETAKFARGDHVHPLQTTVSGNAGTATKLATARTINGTNFDGSANITTANWGTARTLTIGNKGQSVNGSGNVSWALSDIMGRATTTSSADTNKNKYTKFARVDISGGAYRSCTGTFDFVSVESGHVFGILTYYLRTSSAITSTSITLAWKTLTNVAYASSVVAVKVSDGIFDLYYKPVNDWDTMSITNINSNGIEYITLYSSQSFTSSVTATATSSLVNHSATAAKLTTARSITIGNKSNNFDGSGNISFTLSDIGAAASSHGTHLTIGTGASNAAAGNHTHDYLPLSGGTMTGSITLNNNVVIKSKTSAAYTNTSTSASIASGSAVNILTYNSSGNCHVNSGPYDNYLNTGNLYLNSPNHVYLRTANSGGHYMQIDGSTVAHFKNDEIAFAKISYAKAGLKSGGNVYSDTAITDTLGTAALPWKNTYSDSFDIYGEASKSYGSLSAYTTGTTSTVGVTRLTLGNSTASGTASNAKGQILMYGSSSGYTNITPGYNSTSNITITLPSATGSLPVMSKGDTSYWGLCPPDGGTGWIRTTSSGLIPSANGSGALGTSSWQFSSIYGQTIYENGTALSSKYAAASHGTHVSYGGNGSATTVSRSDHTHSYLPLSGGTVTGATTFNNYLKINAWSGYGTGTADIWYDGTNKTVEIDGVTDLKLGETKVTKGAYTIWTGSQSDYNNISSKSSTTLYFIK